MNEIGRKEGYSASERVVKSSWRADGEHRRQKRGENS